MTPMIEAAEREELAKELMNLSANRHRCSSTGRDGYDFTPEKFARIAAALRQSAAAPVVTDELLWKIRSAFQNDTSDTSKLEGAYYWLGDQVVRRDLDGARRVWEALQAALSVQGVGVTVDDIGKLITDLDDNADDLDGVSLRLGEDNPDHEIVDDASASMRKAIAALTQSARSVAEGWKLVPLLPTPEMLTSAGTMEGWTGDSANADANHIEWWQDMVLAAPEPDRR